MTYNVGLKEVCPKCSNNLRFETDNKTGRAYCRKCKWETKRGINNQTLVKKTTTFEDSAPTTAKEFEEIQVKEIK